VGVGSRGKGGAMPPPPWIFIRGTDIVDRGLIVLFFGISLIDLISMKQTLRKLDYCTSKLR